MKTMTTTLLTLMLVMIGQSCQSQRIAAPYEVGTWRGFSTAAVTYTFDDNTPNQFAKAIPMFNEFDFNLTLFIVTSPGWGWSADWNTLREAAAQGHEIASHTVTHTSFSGMKDSLQTIELRDSQAEIEAQIPDQRCITIAYPYCVSPKRSIYEQYYVAGRICSGSIVPKAPKDFMNLSSIICGTEGSVKTAAHFVNKAKLATKNNGWCVYLLHGVDEDGGWSPVPADTLRETLEYFKAHQDSFWVETFGNVVRYIKEREALSVVEASVQDSLISLQVTDSLDNSIFNYPVTLRRPLPEDWPSAIVTQNNEPVETQITNDNLTRYIQFDVVPDNGDVVIAKSNATSVYSQSGRKITSPVLAHNYPNPFNPSTTIQFLLTKTEKVTLEIFDNVGRRVRTLLNEKLPAGPHSIIFDGKGLASGVYFYNLTVNGISLQRKMLLLK